MSSEKTGTQRKPKLIGIALFGCSNAWMKLGRPLKMPTPRNSPIKMYSE